MPHADDQHHKLFVSDLVNHTVGSDAQPPEARELALESRTRGGFIRKAVDRLHEADPVGFRDVAQRSLGAGFDADRVGHSSVRVE